MMENENQTPDPAPTPAGPPTLDKETRQANTFAMLCHLSGLALFIGIPFGNLIGPLVFWLIKKDEYEFVDDQGREALNFQITATLAMIASGILCMILIGLPLLFAVLVAIAVMSIYGAVQASKGERYRYPFTIRLLN